MSAMSSIMQKCNDDNIPLADDDPQVIITDNVENNRLDHGRSMDSLPSSYTGGSSSPGLNGPPSFEPDSGIDEQEEKARLISQVLELQNTLDGKLKWSNKILQFSISRCEVSVFKFISISRMLVLTIVWQSYLGSWTLFKS